MWKLPAFAFASFALAQVPIDTLYGLLDKKLETPRTYFRGLIPKGTFQGKVFYRSTEDTIWHGVRLVEVKYGFYRDLLHTIQIRVEGEEASQQLLILLQTFFGEGKQEGYAPRYRWQGNKATLLYDQNILTRNTLVRMESLELQKKLEREVLRDYDRR